MNITKFMRNKEERRVDNEKAIDVLKRLRIALFNDRVDGDRVFEPLRKGVEALEKQIPKKVIKLYEVARVYDYGF